MYNEPNNCRTMCNFETCACALDVAMLINNAQRLRKVNKYNKTHKTTMLHHTLRLLRHTTITQSKTCECKALTMPNATLCLRRYIRFVLRFVFSLTTRTGSRYSVAPVTSLCHTYSNLQLNADLPSQPHPSRAHQYENRESFGW